MKTQDKKTLFAAVAVSSLLAVGVGVFAGRTLLAPRAQPAAAAEEEDHAGEKPHVAMSQDRIAADNIEVMTLSAGGLDAAITAQATVAATPQGAATLAARADGAVVRIVKRLGDSVSAGETIAAIESRDAAAISAERAAAAAKATAARQALVRERKLFEAKITARQDFEAAQAEAAIADAELRRASSASVAAGVAGNGRTIAVTSPISGRITGSKAVLGAYVTAGTELFRVADPARIEVQAALPAADAARVKPGDIASVETASGVVSATVRSVTPGLDAESRSATAVLTLASGSAQLAPGQALRVRITPRGGPVDDRSFATPEEAVQSVEGRDVVFVRTKDGFEPRPVKTGRRGGGQIEIVSGVRVGDRIAGKGAFLLKAELAKGEAEH